MPQEEMSSAPKWAPAGVVPLELAPNRIAPGPSSPCVYIFCLDVYLKRVNGRSDQISLQNQNLREKESEEKWERRAMRTNKTLLLPFVLYRWSSTVITLPLVVCVRFLMHNKLICYY